MNIFKKFNDLSNSASRDKFKEKAFVPETNFAIAMLRVSTKKQKGQAHFSDKEQEKEVNEYLKRENLILIGKPLDIAETASKHDERRQFLDALDMIRASQSTDQPIKHFVFSHQSRSSRNFKSNRALEDLVDMGVVLHFARDKRKLTNKFELSEYLTWVIENARNVQHIKDHTENVWSGMLGRVECGLFPGKAPYGYMNHRPSEKELSVFKFRDGPDKYMQSAFELFSSGRYSVETLHKELEQRFPYLQKKPKSKRLHELLVNPFYYGDFVFDGVLYKGNPELHPPLISFELWNSVQEIIKGRHRKKRSNYVFSYLHLIRCGGKLLDLHGQETDQVCNCAVTAEYKQRPVKGGNFSTHVLYHCSRNKPDGVCSQRDVTFMRTFAGRNCTYSEAEIEILFEAVFRPLSFTPEVCKWMQTVLLIEHKKQSAQHSQHLSALQSRQKMLQKYMDECYEDKLRGDISEESWREKHSKWRLEQENIKSQIDAIDDTKEEYIQNGVLLIELAQNTEKIYKNAKPAVKRRLVEIVSSNHVLRNGSIEFQYRKPFDILAKPPKNGDWWT